MSETLDRLYAATEHLGVDDRRTVDCIMLGYLSGEVSPEVWEKALAAGLRNVEGIEDFRARITPPTEGRA